MPRQKKAYDNDSIKSLKGPDRVRKRPAVIFGSDGLEGCEHTVFEILSNSVDEAREGHGDKIILTRYLDGQISVEDFGRGIPVEYNKKEERYNWDLVFCELYAGGKMENDNYEFSLGLNGLGTCSTQYSSEKMSVKIRRDGYEYSLEFEKGYNVSPEPGYIRKKTKEHTGTFIKWKPDRTVFTDVAISDEYCEGILRQQAAINPGVHFIFKKESGKAGSFETKEFFYKEGVPEYIKERIDNSLTLIYDFSEETEGRDREDKPPYKLKIYFAFCFTQNDGFQEYYHNSSFLEHGGSPLKAAKAGFTAAIDKYIKAQGKYLKNESKVDATDILDSLVLVTNCFSTEVSYENQTKKAITNKFVQDEMTDFIRDSIERFLIENKVEADKIVGQVLANKRSREQSEKSRIQIKKKLSGTLNATTRPAKYIDCRSKDVSKRELFIAEGDSAVGSLKQARDSEYQAIMPIRGKILNCLKVDLPRIFKSEIITDLIKIMGCGVEVKANSKNIPSFDLSKLKFGKIIFCTDADVDGYQIRTLLLTMVYRLCPTLITEGKIFIAETPLYEISYKDKIWFAYDEKEKAAILKPIKDKPGIKIQRSKGLGENDAEMMSLTTMNPATRRLIQITRDDAEQAEILYNTLLGNDLTSRKEYISEHGAEYLDALDI